MEERVRPFRHPSIPGTINTIMTIVVINTPMTPDAMVRTVMNATNQRKGQA